MAKQKLTVKSLMKGIKAVDDGRFQFVAEISKKERVITVGPEYAQEVARRLMEGGATVSVEDLVTHAVYGARPVDKSARKLAGIPVITWQEPVEIDGKSRYPRGVNPFVEPELSK